MGLERFFAWLDRALSPRIVEEASGVVADALPPRPATPAPGFHPRAAVLSVDGGGQYLLFAGDVATLGHARAGEADLGFLADVGAQHARLVRADSLQSGPGWRLEPLQGEKVAIDGEPLGPAGRRIEPGQTLRLGENLELRTSVPDPASACLVLELLRGAQCFGARHIVLLAEGRGGRLRLGSAVSHQVRVPGLAFTLEVLLFPGELEFRCEEPLRGALQGTLGRLRFPPTERLSFACGSATGPRPPFGLFLEPVRR